MLGGGAQAHGRVAIMIQARTALCTVALLVQLSGLVLEASQPPTATPQHRFLSLYERIAQQEKDQPGYMTRRAKDSKEAANAAWLAGKWACDVTVFATPTTPERKGGPPEEQELVNDANGDLFDVKRGGDGVTRAPYLFFDPRALRWVAPMGDAVGWGVLTSPAWQGSTLVLSGHVSIMGSQTDLRQTITRVGKEKYTILNEEATPEGRWVRLDWYECGRKSK